MKKVFKFLGLALLTLFAVSLILGNIANIIVSKRSVQQGRTLEDMVAEINQHLPMKQEGFDFFSLDSVILKKKQVIWCSTADTTFFYPNRESMLPETLNGGLVVAGDRTQLLDLDTLLSSKYLKEDQELNSLYYQLFARKNQKDAFHDELMKRQYAQTWRFHSPFSNRSCEFTITYDEQRKLIDFCNNKPKEALQLFIRDCLHRHNRILKLASRGTGTHMSMKDTGDAFILSIVFDKAFKVDGEDPIYSIRANRQEVLKGLQEDFQRLPMFFGMKEICEKTKRKFVVRCVNFSRTDSVDFDLM